MPETITSFDKWRAFGVHLLTASGAFLAFMSLIAAAEQRWVAMFGWLGFALFVDGIDGPLARKIEIKRVLPNWSGDLLDSIIDYSTFCLIPAVALYLSGMIGRPWSFVAAALIMISSAIYYADTRMKTKDNFFRGFPVCWNMLVFTFFAIRPNEGTAFAFVFFCAVATFLPIRFLHPVRVVRLRTVNLSVFAVWSLLGLVTLGYNWSAPPDSFDAPDVVRWGLVITGLYLFSIGGLLQLVDRLRGVARD